ncbi:hypothetical protein [Actinomycetospora sp. CA-053990]|uniref:hypothetical protein n=1 Tax=Actinomycetospora sp. CA-053990 TaxID=3239891 RepID=UPI003D941A6B
MVVEMFGEAREEQGDLFGQNQYITPSTYYYLTSGVLTSAMVWGESDKAGVSFFSCARAEMVPTLDLYRYVGLWRSTCGIGAPYVVEFNSRAAVMCQQELSGNDFKNDEVIARQVAVMFDLISETSRILGQDLSRADGVRLEETAPDIEEAQLAVHQYWQVSDPRISELMGLS